MEIKKEGTVPPPPPPSSSMPPHPQAPAQSLVQRYKYVWRFLLISNLALGAYMFASARKKERSVVVRRIEVKAPPEPVAEEPIPPPPEDIVFSPPIPEPVIEREPIPAYQQQELFKWMLEEKRKTKPKNREEKKRIDEEKALLKQYISSNSIPDI